MGVRISGVNEEWSEDESEDEVQSVKLVSGGKKSDAKVMQMLSRIILAQI
jgi:hypothetical protein